MTTGGHPPPLDRECADALSGLPAQAFEPLRAEGVVELRERMAPARPSDAVLRCEGAVEIDEMTVPGPPGAPDLSMLLLRPARGAGLRPGVYYTHSGGMVSGDNRTGVAELAGWVAELGVAVASVEYRLAPEHPYPAAVEDCYAGLAWTAEHAETLGIDPERLAIAGMSGGGGLAAATTLLARDRGRPALSHQILLCPMLDDREVTMSSGFEGVLWDRVSNRTAWASVLGAARGRPDVSPYAAPARAESLAGLPPAFLDVGGADIFRDETLDYAARLAGAGVPVELHVWAGGFHGFEQLAPMAEVSKAARAVRSSWLRRAFRE